jgi:hypothetical protein
VEAQLKCEEEGRYLAHPKTIRLDRVKLPGWRNTTLKDDVAKNFGKCS